MRTLARRIYTNRRDGYEKLPIDRIRELANRQPSYRRDWREQASVGMTPAVESIRPE